MTELNPQAVMYALTKYTDDVNDVLGGNIIMAISSDAPTFIEHYEDYERNSWLTTQE